MDGLFGHKRTVHPIESLLRDDRSYAFGLVRFGLGEVERVHLPGQLSTFQVCIESAARRGRQGFEGKGQSTDRRVKLTRPIFCTNSSESLHHSLGP